MMTFKTELSTENKIDNIQMGKAKKKTKTYQSRIHRVLSKDRTILSASKRINENSIFYGDPC